ncbi:AAA family ATPase, partial [Rhodobacterales bacterium HKCCE3408]|nr:AAA family ATPase [Rhodobacterales bacterium HKCCE3408]
MSWDQALKAAEVDANAVDPAGNLPAMVSARELQSTEFPPVSWVVDGMLPEGVTLFAGKPKLGKSWLALQIGYGVSETGEVLGRPAKQGSVLYAALEDNHRRLKKRMERVALSADTWPDRFLFSTEWPRLDGGGLEAFQAWVDATPDARLLIVDTLATVRPATGGRDSQYQSDY